MKFVKLVVKKRVPNFPAQDSLKKEFNNVKVKNRQFLGSNTVAIPCFDLTIFLFSYEHKNCKEAM